MKTTGSIVTKITLGLAVAASVVACNNNKPAAAPAAATSTTTTSEKGATVYINSDTLMAQYGYAKDMQDRLTTKAKAADAEVQSKLQAFQREVADYKKIANTEAADKRQDTEQRLAREQQELQQFKQNSDIDMQKYQSDEATKFYQKTTDFARSYAKEKGYKAVLTYSRSNPTVLYVEPSLDITADIVKELNDAYAKEKK